MLADIPMVLIFVGLAAYIMLAGADFGVGFWILFSGERRAGRIYLSDYLRHAMGPVWEANHVWLIFVLVVCWTAYPLAFASITSTLVVPLLIAAVGIILRGTAYALKGQLDTVGGRWQLIDRVFALSSLLTPFALGAAIGGIASGRVPVGNEAGDLIKSWLNPTSIIVGILSVSTSSYLAAVYLAADARRTEDDELVLSFRRRAIGAGVVAGLVAIGGLLVLRQDAVEVWNGLMRSPGIILLCLSIVAGCAALGLVWRHWYNVARCSAGLAVGTIVAAWALAQQPNFLPGLTVSQAAADNSALLPLIWGIAGGLVILVLSLFVLFNLFLRGLLDPVEVDAHQPVEGRPGGKLHRRRLTKLAIVFFLLGNGLTVLGSGLVLGLGVICLVICAGSIFVLAAPAEETEENHSPVGR